MKGAYIYRVANFENLCLCSVKVYSQNSWVDIEHNSVDFRSNFKVNSNYEELDCLNSKFIKWGYLYNGYAMQDARNIANPTNGWRLPNNSDMVSLSKPASFPSDLRGTGFYNRNNFYPILRTGYFRKAFVGNEVESTNSHNFSAIPTIVVIMKFSEGGFPNEWSTTFFNDDGNFCIPINETFVNSESSECIHYYYAKWSNESAGLIKSVPNMLNSILKFDYTNVRLCRDLLPSESVLVQGSFLGDYVGNDGKTYKAVKIYNRAWLAEYLTETKYANGDNIVFNTTKSQIETTAWINFNAKSTDSAYWSKNPYGIKDWFNIYNDKYTGATWFTNDIKFNIE
jgi:hypothetical protein